MVCLWKKGLFATVYARPNWKCSLVNQITKIFDDNQIIIFDVCMCTHNYMGKF